MGITLANNAHTTLSADASSTDTTIYVEDIDSFPTLGVGDYFYLTLERTSGAMEIVKVTQINASSFDVVRGQENTIPISFPIGSLVSLKMTVQNITDLILTGSNINDDAFDSSWNGDTTDAPSRNTVYDKIVGIETDYVAADAVVAANAAAAVAALGTVYAVGGTDVALADGGTGASLTDPNADRIMFWDDSAGQVTWLQPNSPLNITGTGLGWSTNALSVGGSGTTTATTSIGHNAGGGATASLLFTAAGNPAWTLKSDANTNDNLTLTAGDAAGGGVGAGLVLTIPRTTGVAAFAITPTVPDDAYAAGWDGSTQVPTKNAVYDKIQSLATLSDGDKGDITVSASGATWTIDNSTVTLAKMANMATASLIYRKTAGTGAPEVNTLATLKTDLGLTGTNSGDQTITLTGDVTGSGTGSFATTIANNAVTLAKMATMATDSILGRATAATGNVEVLTALPWAYTGDVTRPADSNATTIASGVVTYAKMASAAIATATEMQAGTASKLIDAATVLTAGDVETVSYSATTTFDFTTFVNAKITLTGNVTFANPTTTGMKGRSGWIEVVQDATGSRTATWGANYKFAGGTDIVLSTAANTVDLIFYAILSDGTVYVSAAKDAKN